MHLVQSSFAIRLLTTLHSGGSVSRWVLPLSPSLSFSLHLSVPPSLFTSFSLSLPHAGSAPLPPAAHRPIIHEPKLCSDQSTRPGSIRNLKPELGFSEPYLERGMNLIEGESLGPLPPPGSLLHKFSPGPQQIRPTWKTKPVHPNPRRCSGATHLPRTTGRIRW